MIHSKYIFRFILLFILILSFSVQPVMSQAKQSYTREQVLAMSYDQLLALPFDELMNLADVVGVSADELLSMILNKEVFSASKTNETVFNSPLSTTVLTKEELLNSGVTTIEEALRLVPGMIVREKTPGNYDVHIRGGDNVPPKNIPLYSENMMTLVMIDGRPVYNYAFGGTFWESLPVSISDVERIEVIRGPSSALYGPNAVSGVINIISKRPEGKRMQVSGDIQAGNLNARQANIATNFGLGDKLKVRVSANYLNRGRFNEGIYHYDSARYYSVDEISTLQYNQYMPLGVFQYQEFNIKNRIPDPSTASDRKGINGLIAYQPNANLNFDLAVGWQNSDVITNVFGNHEVTLNSRTSNTQYIDFRSKVYGLQTQINYNFGNQDIERLIPGFHVDLEVLNASTEYQLNFGSLTLRPGISYNQAVYSDAAYVDEDNKGGYMNGSKNLNTFAYFLRADYKVLDALRLGAAIRGDKYNKPDKNYITYQFLASYSINDKNMLRAVYSRANRGPFMVDTYSDYHWWTIRTDDENIPEDQQARLFKMRYLGNDNLKLPQMDMFEVGFRSMINKSVQVDVEFFRTKTTDYSYFTLDSMSVYPQPGYNALNHVIDGKVQYLNSDMSVVQQGVTATLNIAASKKLTINVFGTLQKTDLTKVDTTQITQVAGNQMMQYIGQIQVNGSLGQPTIISEDMNEKTSVDMKNESTPVFYGGATLNYTPAKKWNINASAYYYTQQKYMVRSNVDTIEPKLIVNAKLSYRFYGNQTVYINARNLLNNRANEFGFLDQIGGLYQIGVNLQF